MEEWKDIAGYEGLYKISNRGRVKKMGSNEIISQNRISAKKEFIMSLNNRNGYLRIGFNINHKKLTYSVHRLVAEAFIPNPDNKPHVNHIDGNKSNNNADNLEWVTRSENIKHSYSLGLHKPMKGSNNAFSILTEENVIRITDLLKTNMLHKDIANIFNVTRDTITKINMGKNWSHLTGIKSK